MMYATLGCRGIVTRESLFKFRLFPMMRRIIFTFVAGLVGLLIGLAAGIILQEPGQPFPAYVVTAFVVLFAVSGFCAKDSFIEHVIDFFFRGLWP